MPRSSSRLCGLWLAAALGATPAAAAQRAFVASYGSDTNVPGLCNRAAPCRTFATALTIVDAGGEVLALDASEHGPLTITKSVTITANPGVRVYISTSSVGGAAVAISGGARVVLRNLDLVPSPYGGGFGVSVLSSEAVVENCTISRVDTGIYAGNSRLRVANSIVRNTYRGIYLFGTNKADISEVQVIGSYRAGLEVGVGLSSLGHPVCTSGNARVSVTDSLIDDSGWFGIGAWTYESSAAVHVAVTRSIVSGGPIGILTSTSPLGVCGVIGDVRAAVGDSQIANNTEGFEAGPNTTFESMGDNLLAGNGTDTVGTITPIPGI
jgi:hypothetical protein